jgi:hypothetical protein
MTSNALQSKLVAFKKVYETMGKYLFAETISCMDDDTMLSFIEALPTLGLTQSYISDIIKHIMDIVTKSVRYIPHTNCLSSCKPLPWTSVEHPKTLRLLHSRYGISAHLLVNLVPRDDDLRYSLEKYLTDDGEGVSHEKFMVEFMKEEPIHQDESKSDSKKSPSDKPIVETGVHIDTKSIDAKTEVKTCFQCKLPFPHISTPVTKWMNCACRQTAGYFPAVPYKYELDEFVEKLETIRAIRCAAHERALRTSDKKSAACETLCLTCRYKRPISCNDCERVDTELIQVRPHDWFDTYACIDDPYPMIYVCADGCVNSGLCCKECKVEFKDKREIYVDVDAIREFNVLITLHYVCESCVNRLETESHEREYQKLYPQEEPWGIVEETMIQLNANDNE